MNQNIEINEALKIMIKDSIREVLAEERISLIQALIPSVSKKELTDIERRYGKPEDYKKKEMIDMTRWFFDEN
ncbi:hypothetical protein ABRY23_10570 [Melioribacteraceae bacterium 4301-Me]|uniref:hypothetical protein n=1 Tax=Pyranulibacter aquaticus TaxID=3163344 RepID=UPI0035956A39